MTEDEQKLIDELYGLPKEGYFKRPTHIWIIEWLSSNDPHTGRELHKRMQEYKYFQSIYWKCSSKDEVLAAIERAATDAEHHGIIPLIHLEAHGSTKGLSDREKGVNGLTWDELTNPLQRLNIATRFNLIVLIAACQGYAGILTFVKALKESRLTAPALVIAGPYDDLKPKQVLDSTQEFYRRLSDQPTNFDDAIVSASNEVNCKIDRTIFPVLLYDEMLENLIVSMREDQRVARMNRTREQFLKENKKKRLSPEEKRRLAEAYSPSFQANITQQGWDAIFMMDIFPENKKRFGVDWLNVTKKILDIQKNNPEQIIQRS
uniref:hypothetical protein n=1 Tax=Candidatus Electronema sp. TaxID=2698783 RepID=UPI004057C7CC